MALSSTLFMPICLKDGKMPFLEKHFRMRLEGATGDDIIVL